MNAAGGEPRDGPVAAPPDVPDLVVLSDLHLGLGENPASGRFHRLEAFFYDDDFASFAGWLCADAARSGRQLRMILAGDSLDFLRVERGVALPGEGPGVTRAAALARAILAGHPGVVHGLAELLAAGHELVLLPGNHDLELQRDDVRAELRQALASALRVRGLDDAASEQALARLAFANWFHHEPGRIWIEHGSQYDPEGAFRYLLRGPSSSEESRDLPLGNFFQRHLYNAFGSLASVVPATPNANRGYLRWLMLHRPRTLVQVLYRHLPLAVRLIWRFARSAAQAPPPALARAHAAGLAAEALASPLGERVREVDALKQVGDLHDAAWRVGRQLVRAGLFALLISLLVLGTFSAGNLAIASMRTGLWPKALLSVGLTLMLLLLGAVGLVLVLLRPAPPPLPGLADAARHIARLTSVPLVVFGHTHCEDVRPLPGGWYFNTGTWIAVFLDGELSPRSRVQASFLRVEGKRARLMRWNPDQGRALPVLLLEE
ncbi:MAG: metallophosphoesterase [Deltaproteobacteria bacterium]|nr:metallophosphoesterase [Deltaproteobacteria bacterium]